MLLITGGNGFLGQHLKKHCISSEILTPSSSDLNLLNEKSVCDYLKHNNVNRIIHAAAYSGGISIHKNFPGDVAVENLKMGVNLLEAAAKIGGIKIILIMTVCSYPVDASIPTPESSLHIGYPAEDTAYFGYAKRMLHVLCDALSKQYDFKFASIIPTNLYGPGDNYSEKNSHVIPALIKRIHHAKMNNLAQINVWGDGSQIRDFLYVDDCAKAIIDALNLLDKGNVNGQLINLGSKTGTTIKNLVEIICQIIGFSGEIVWETNKPTGAPIRVLDISKAERLLSFQPQKKLVDGLKLTYLDYLESGKII